MAAIPLIALLLLALYLNFWLTRSNERRCECGNPRNFTMRHDDYLCQPWYESL